MAVVNKNDLSEWEKAQQQLLENANPSQRAVLESRDRHDADMARIAENLEAAKAAEESWCFSCPLIGKYSDLAAGYVGELSSILSPVILDVFNTAIPLWLSFSLITVLINISTWVKFFHNLLYVLIAYMMFTVNQADFINTIYTLSLDIMGGTATLALLGGTKLQIYTVESYASSGMVNLVYTAEVALEAIFDLAFALMGETKFVPGLGLLFGLCIIVPYFALLTVYFSKVSVAIFRVMLLAMFSPVIIMCFAFDWGRPMMKTAVKTLFASIMILFACTAAMSMLVYGAQELTLQFDTSQDTLFTKHKTEVFLIILLGLMGTAFMAEANGVANSLAGSVLTNAAAAIMTGGVMAGAAAASRYAGKQISNATSNGGVGGSIKNMAMKGAIAATVPGAAPIMAAVGVMNRLSSLKSQAAS